MSTADIDLASTADRDGGVDPYEALGGMYELFAAAQGDRALPSVEAFARLALPGMKVLDVGAGTGRVALAVAEKGAWVWCVEPSAGMRSVLLAKLAQRADLWPRVTVLEGKAPDLRLGDARFDYAYLAGSLQFLDAGQRIGTFRRLARCLRPGGLLAVDMVGMSPPGADRGPAVVATATVGDGAYTLEAEITAVAPERVDASYRYTTRQGGQHTQIVVLRTSHVHSFGEVAHDLSDAGFTIVESAGSAHHPDHPDPGDPVVARRNA